MERSCLVVHRARGNESRDRAAKCRRPAGSSNELGIVSFVRRIQRLVGNRSLQGLLQQGMVQAKLAVSRPDDEHEREAERVADEVMQMTTSSAVARQRRPLGVTTPLIAMGVQRYARYFPAVVNTINDASEQIAEGKAMATTTLELNGRDILSADAAREAIERPTIGRRPTKEGVECWIASAPDNYARSIERVLNSGPWSTVTRRHNLSFRLLLPKCAAAPEGRVLFLVSGQPSDASVARANRIHEDHHVADDRIAFELVVKPWDDNMERAVANHEKYTGTDAMACESSLHEAMGGDADAIADQLMFMVDELGTAFHADPAGRPIRVYNTETDKICHTVSADVKSV